MNESVRKSRQKAAGAASAPVGPDDYEVVLVTYHSRGQLEGFLENVSPDQRLVVVDNASGADDVGELLAAFSRARLIDGNDVGFARAANLGALSSDAEYVVFANPDSRPTPQVWAELVESLRADPQLGSAAAATVGPHGEIEIGVGGWEPTIGRVFVYATGLHRLFPRAGVYAVVHPNEQVDLGWITGACLAVSQATFSDMGGFTEAYFVYNEDMELGRRLRARGLGQRLRTDLLVPHATSGSGGGGTRMPQQKGASMGRYLADHNGVLRASIMRATLVGGSLVRAAAAGIRGRRDTARHHLAYIRGILTLRSPYEAANRPRT